MRTWFDRLLEDGRPYEDPCFSYDETDYNYWHRMPWFDRLLSPEKEPYGDHPIRPWRIQFSTNTNSSSFTFGTVVTSNSTGTITFSTE